MNRSLALQILNGYISVIAICATFIFANYLWLKRKQDYEELRPAIAMLGLWIGEQILRGPIFFQRTLANAGMPSAEPILTIFVGGLIFGVSALCCIRVFSPAKWRYWSWLGTFILSTLVVAASLMFVSWR